jgi:hypothetical protein
MQKDRLYRAAWIIAVLLFIVQFAPYILRADAYIRIHDTLEGEWMWYAAIVDNGVAMNYDMSAEIDQWMGGLPRYLFPTGISLTTLLVFLFGTVGGYIVSAFLVDAVAFTGCFLLFRRYVFTEDDERHWPVLIGSLYSIIPFFTTFGISIAGLPLLMLAFLEILKDRSRYRAYAFIVFFPFYSNMVWSILFVNALALAVLIVNTGRSGRLPVLIGLLALMNAIYIAANYHLVYAYFLSDLVLQREAYDPLAQHPRSFLKSIGESAYMFFANHYHIGTMVNLPILLLALLVPKGKHIRRLLWLALFIALLNGFYLYLVPALGKIHPLLLSFRITRVKMLLPFLWMGILAWSIKGLIKQPYGKSISAFTMAVLLFSTLFANDEILNNYRNLLGYQKKPDAGQFFAKETWQQIADHIGRDKAEYRIAHLGLNPAISLYNGFATIDGLQAIYPLEHKQYMVDVMSDELLEDEALMRYIHTWGNRCYFFSSELGKEHEAFMIDKSVRKVVKAWNIDTGMLLQRGVEYVFSSVEIGNAGQLDMELEKIFETEQGYWRVYLYRIGPGEQAVKTG